MRALTRSVGSSSRVGASNADTAPECRCSYSVIEFESNESRVGVLGHLRVEIDGCLLETVQVRLGRAVLHVIGDHPAPPIASATIPLRPVSRSFWKNSANARPDCASTTLGNNAVSGFLRSSSSGQIQEDRIESVEIDTGRIPARIEVARLFLGRHETSVEPHAAASGVGQGLERIRQAVEQLASATVPAETPTNSSQVASCSPSGSRPVSGSKAGNTPPVRLWATAAYRPTPRRRTLRESAKSLTSAVTREAVAARRAISIASAT